MENGLFCVNLNETALNFMEIENRRFMYNRNGWLILGAEDTAPKKHVVGSHAEEFHQAKEVNPMLPNYDDFVRGWIGVGGSYKKGIIHFAPHIPSADFRLFDHAFSFVEATLQNGFTSETILRGFPGEWEQKIEAVGISSDKRKSTLAMQIESAAERVAEYDHSVKNGNTFVL